MQNTNPPPSTPSPQDRLDWLCINTVRTLSIDAVQKANSGHPGLPLGAAPFAYILFQNHLKFNPQNPHFADRDRFVLSAGHGSMLLYSLLHLYGYPLSLQEIQNFRQLGSLTPGHPEAGLTPGVEATTGPLGQGAANAVGMAIAERRLASLFNTSQHSLVDHFTYCLVGDGDLMEGVSTEAASLAGHLQLGKLIYLYDSNDISLDGPTSLTFTENVAQRYESYGWQVITVPQADTDLLGIDRAIQAAKADLTRPSLIILKTTIGYGSPHKAGKSAAHGSPLGPEEVQLTKKALGWTESEAFQIPADALAHMSRAAKRGAEAEKKWNEQFRAWQKANPDLAQIWEQTHSDSAPLDLDSALPRFKPGEDFATRESSGKCLNAVAKINPCFFGGDADLSCSTNTLIQEGGSFHGPSGAGKNIHYGVREHAMGAIANGIAYHQGLRTFTATFFCFADYMKPAIRLAAMNHLPVIFIFTHDSVGLGEDGPTHQPVEHLMSLRGIPNLLTLRPADSNEVRECWKLALENTRGPTALILSRQKLQTLDRGLYGLEKGVTQGAYILSDSPGFQAILVATGSEVQTALQVQKNLAQKNIPVRVVSMPSMEWFLKQPISLQNTILPPECKKRVSIEAGITLGWSEITGSGGLRIGVDTFGISAPAGKIYQKLGLDPAQVTERVLKWFHGDAPTHST